MPNLFGPALSRVSVPPLAVSTEAAGCRIAQRVAPPEATEKPISQGCTLGAIPPGRLVLQGDFVCSKTGPEGESGRPSRWPSRPQPKVFAGNMAPGGRLRPSPPVQPPNQSRAQGPRD